MAVEITAFSYDGYVRKMDMSETHDALNSQGACNDMKKKYDIHQRHRK